jgi:hypothetical protein
MSHNHCKQGNDSCDAYNGYSNPFATASMRLMALALIAVSLLFCTYVVDRCCDSNNVSRGVFALLSPIPILCSDFLLLLIFGFFPPQT